MVARFWLLTLAPLLALLSYVILLVAVLQRVRRSAVYRFFAFYLLAMAVWSLGSAMMRLDPSRIRMWNRVLSGGAIIMPFAFFGFVQAFLGQEPNRWLWAGFAVLLVLEAGIMMGLTVTDARLLEGGLLEVDIGPGIYAEAAYWVFFVGVSTWSLVQAYRETRDPVLRNRIRYPLLGVFFVLLGGSTNTLPGLGALPIDHAANVVNAALLTYAIFRYQLVDLTLVVRKGLFYSIPTVIIGAGYFLLISLATRLFAAFTGLQVLFVSLVVAVTAAVLAQPLRDRAQTWVDRLFFREQYDSRLMLQRLSRTAASVLDLDLLTKMILDEVITTIHIKSAAFFLRQEESGEFRLTAYRGPDQDVNAMLRKDHPIASWLTGRDRVLSRHDLEVMPYFKALWRDERVELERMGLELFIPLEARGELVGILAVGPKLSDEAYSQDDQLALITLASQVAVAIQKAWLYRQAQQEIVERRRAEQDRERLLDELEAKNRELESFVYTVSHDLKAPLISIDGFSSVLESEFYDQLGEGGQHYLSRIRANVAQMDDLIVDLLELSRIGRVVGPTVEIDVVALLQEVQEQLVVELEAAGAQLIVEESLPVVRADRGRMRQVFANLIDNAAKFRSKTRPLCIEIGCRVEQEAYRFHVSDNGMGIAPQYHEQVFDPFQQLDPGTEGVGMGLALVKKIIEHHHGRIWVESNEGEGATFYFTLPRDGGELGLPEEQV